MVDLETLFEHLRRGGEYLPSEAGIYVVLEACERALLSPGIIRAQDIRFTADGAVLVGSVSGLTTDDEASDSLRKLLTEVLLAAGPEIPPDLMHLVDPTELGKGLGTNLQQFRDSVEAALVPLNPSASRRMIAKLVREYESEHKPLSLSPPQAHLIQEAKDRVEDDVDKLLGVDRDEAFRVSRVTATATAAPLRVKPPFVGPPRKEGPPPPPPSRKRSEETSPLFALEPIDSGKPSITKQNVPQAESPGLHKLSLPLVAAPLNSERVPAGEFEPVELPTAIRWKRVLSVSLGVAAGLLLLLLFTGRTPKKPTAAQAPKSAVRQVKKPVKPKLGALAKAQKQSAELGKPQVVVSTADPTARVFLKLPPRGDGDDPILRLLGEGSEVVTDRLRRDRTHTLVVKRLRFQRRHFVVEPDDWERTERGHVAKVDAVLRLPKD